MSAVPKQIRDQEREAEQLRQQIYGDGSETEGQEGDNAPADPEAQPEPESEAASDGTPGDDTSASEQEGEPKQEDDPNQRKGWVTRDEYDRLMSTYKTLKGKYDAEVPRLQQQVSDKGAEIARLHERIANAGAGEGQGQGSSGDQDLDGLIQRLRDDFGDDFADTVQAVARNVATNSVKESREEGQQEQWQRFINSVRRNIPDFDAINQSQEFVDWLNATPDPATGGTMQDKLEQAGSDMDALTVKAVVDEFKARNQQPEPETPPNPDPEPDPTAPESQVSPNKGNQRSAPDQKPQYTAQDFQALQREIQDGKWKGRMDEARALEREIHAQVMGQQQ